MVMPGEGILKTFNAPTVVSSTIRGDRLAYTHIKGIYA